ncbi:CHAT domain-containing protein [Streptomyces sp. NPDC001514]
MDRWAERAQRLAELGRLDEAEDLLWRGLTRVDTAVGGWNDARYTAFVRLGEVLDDVISELGDLDGLRRLLIWLRVRAGTAGRPEGEMFALAKLALVDGIVGDFATAVTRGRELLTLWSGEEGLEEAAEEWGTWLGQTAREAYHAGEYEHAAELADLALALKPDQPFALFAASYGAHRLGRLERSLEFFDRFIAAHPDRTSSHEGRAVVLSHLDRKAEAVEAIGVAVRHDPDQPRYRLTRAQLLTDADRPAAALPDLNVCVDLAAAEAAVLAADPGADLPYVDTLPTEDLVERAVGLRIAVLEGLGREDDAVLCLHEALADPRLRRFERLRDALTAWPGDGPAAIRDRLTTRIAAGVEEAPLRLALARCLIVLDEVDRALEVLDRMRLEPYDLESYDAMPGLLNLLAVRHPDAPGVRRLLADVLIVRWRPQAALVHLDVLLSLKPGDWYGLLLRGMAQVTHNEPGWTEPLSGASVTAALEDLVDSAEAAPPGERRPLSALRWLLQLALAIPDLRDALLILLGKEAEPYDRILAALPGLKTVVQRLIVFEHVLNPAQALAESDEQLGLARAEAAALGLPQLAAQLDLRHADVLLRRSEVQAAMDHLAAAEAVVASLGQFPNAEYLPSLNTEETQAVVARAHHRGRTHMVFDLDHVEVMMTAHGYLQKYIDLIGADIQARLGDVSGALALLAERPPWEDPPEHLIRSRRLLTARLLRDTRRCDDALATLGNTANDLDAAHLEATVLRLQGDLSGAVRVERRILDELELDAGHRMVTAANLADALRAGGDARAALRTLDDHPPPADAQPQARAGWHQERGWVLDALGRPEEALADLLAALDLGDRVRGGFRADDDRISWHTRNLPLLADAVSVAVAAGRLDTALELAERARARAFVDGLALGPIPRGPEAAELEAPVVAARERRRLLLDLAADPGADTAAATVERLRELGTDLGADLPVPGERIAEEISHEGPALRRLEQRLLQAALGARESLAGRVSTAAEIRALLAPGVLLAEFTASGLLLVTPDGTAWHPAETPDESLVQLRENSRPDDLICLVPSGPLHHQPLHTSLIDRNPVCYLPSASVLAHCRARRPHPPPRPFTAVVLGDSRDDLPNARVEATAVARLLGARPHLGGAATRDLLTDTYDVVHIACHAAFDKDHPEQSGILLGSGRLTVEDVYDLRLNAGLVVLSACESGLADNRPGDELMGLVRAFLHAGAAALVVSLWPVDDLSTALLMSEFYRRWRGEGTDPARALAAAQLTIRDLTCADAIGRIDAEAEAAADRTAALLETSRLRARAGDLPAAIDGYETLLTASDTPTDLIQRRLRLLRLKAEAPETVDYGRRPFADPYHWAAFMLVGDWRTG